MTDPLLRVEGIDVAYDQTQVLFGVSLEVERGEILALLGTNGAGKSTVLKAVSGLLHVSSGRIEFEGGDITNSGPNQIARISIAQVPGGRGIFPSLSVKENLRVAGWLFRKDKAYVQEATQRVLGDFPALEQRWETPAGSLSGGEQQMLSLAQAFIAKPTLLMIDELSLGLAPTIVERLLEIVRGIHDNGTTIVLVEQSVNVALRLAHRAVFMEKGEVRFSGPTKELLARTDILRSVYLKGAAAIVPDESVPSRVVLRERNAMRERLLTRPAVLETIGLTKRYGGVTAVDSVDLRLHHGQILGLVGPNGAGKTSILDLVSGFTKADGGHVFVSGVDATGLAAHERAVLGLGRSFQDARLWPSLTVGEAIAAAHERLVESPGLLPAALGFPAAKSSERAVWKRTEELIELLGLGAFRDKFISELSTGSRRMVEIGALMASEPTILLLDEPSSGIAQKEAEALGPVLKQVQSWMAGSILIIEHDMPLLAGLADHFVALESGGVIAFGTPEEVLNHPRVVESYLGTSDVSDLTETGRRRRRIRKARDSAHINDRSTT